MRALRRLQQLGQCQRCWWQELRPPHRAAASISDEGVVLATKGALAKLGRYPQNEDAWQLQGRKLLQEGTLEKLEPKDLLEFVKLMAQDVGMTQAGFWEALASRTAPKLRSAELEFLVDLAEHFTRIQAYSGDCIQVFREASLKVRSPAVMAVHTLKPRSLTRLLSIFARAGAGSRELSRDATQLFNEMEERVVSAKEVGVTTTFEVEDCLSLVGSMASFRATKTLVLQELGREVLHPKLSELSGSQTAQLCHSYGELGWRHDTVFRSVSTEMVQEFENMQRARIFGEVSFTCKYSVSDVALITLAMLRLKMFRGNTSWFKWGDTYNDMVDILRRRMETDLSAMCAKSLAAASFVLGRARQGTEELYKAMYDHMMQLLDGQAKPVAPSLAHPLGFQDPPQEELVRFMHGLAMMGPKRQKDLDTQWLMQWLTKNVYTFVLSDFILVNRHLVAIKCYDREYLLMLVPFFCEEDRAAQLGKSDVIELTSTYNGAKIREEDIPGGLGRHFFWMLGRQYQKAHVASLGLRKRAQLQRRG